MALIIATIIVLICLILLGLTADFLVDWLWFSAIGYLDVFWTTIGAEAEVFLVVFMATAIIMWVNGSWASRFARSPCAQQPDDFEWKRTGTATLPDVLEFMRHRLPWPLVIPGGAGLLAVLVAWGEANNWGVFLRFLYHVPYGATDPLYDKDIGFYLFSLPAYVVIKNWMLLTLFLSALFAGAIYWVRGGIEYDTQRRSISPAVIAHGSALLGFFFAVKAWSYGLDRYLLLYGDNGVVIGASYTDIHVELPVLWLLIGFSIVAACAAWANVRVRTYRLPAAAAVLVFGGSFVLSGVVPGLFQRLFVKPNELEWEKPYIEHNIALTRQAYNLHQIEAKPFPAEQDLSFKALEANKATIDNIRLWDWGDGVLIYFGYPQAHEDDAERAVRTGLELIAAVTALKAPAPLQTRIGIATGLVVVGDLIGSGEAQERGIVGETPNLAARLQSIAEPNMVVIADGTRKLLGNLFDLQDLGPKDLKGIASPVRVWSALRASSAEGRFEALHGTGLTSLVGRQEELELLLRRWSKAKGGEGQVVLLSGEPGIGKSRLTAALMERLAPEPHTRLRYFCSPHHQDSALYPSIAQLERAAGFRREDTAEQRLNKLEAVLAQGTNDLREAVPLLADLLSIPTGGRYPPLDLTPQKRKEKTLDAQLAQVEGLAARQPVLMVFEDIHWSDPTTRESLDLLVDRIPTLRVLVILTFRPEFLPPWLGRPHVTMVTLNRLPPRQRTKMIAHVTGGKALPKEIAEQIVDRTDGVPLFIEEFTKSVVESGIVRKPGIITRVAGPVTSHRDSKLAARLSARPTRSSGADARGGADRLGPRPLLLARTDRRRCADAAAEIGRGAGATGRRRTDFPPRQAARC